MSKWISGFTILSFIMFFCLISTKSVCAADIRIFGSVEAEIYPHKPTDPLKKEALKYLAIEIVDLDSTKWTHDPLGDSPYFTDEQGRYDTGLISNLSEDDVFNSEAEVFLFAELRGPHVVLFDGFYDVIGQPDRYSYYFGHIPSGEYDHSFVWEKCYIPPNCFSGEEQNVYYHITRAYDYFTKTLNYTDSNGKGFMTYPMEVYINTPSDPEGSLIKKFFDAVISLWEWEGAKALGSSIYFGDAKQYAFYSDVIIHEYTHNVVNKLYNGDSHQYPFIKGAFIQNVIDNDINISSSDVLKGYYEAFSMDEGIADYFAATMNYNQGDEPIIGEGLLENPRYINDSHNTIKYNEVEWYNTSWNDTKVVENAYYNSQIISSTLWKIRESLTAEITDKLIFEALKENPTSFKGLYFSLLRADDDNNNLDDLTTNFKFITDAFREHAIIDGLGSIWGFVSDNIWLIQDASITLVNKEQTQLIFNITDENGFFAIQDVKIGEYYLLISKDGYKNLRVPEDKSVFLYIPLLTEKQGVPKERWGLYAGISWLKPCYTSRIPLELNQEYADQSTCQGYFQQYEFTVTPDYVYRIIVEPTSGDPDLYASKDSSVIENLLDINGDILWNCFDPSCDSSTAEGEGLTEQVIFFAPTSGDPYTSYFAVYGVTDVDYSIQITSSPLIVTQGITLSPSSPYYVGNPLTSEFTIKNTSINDVEIEELLLKGQGPEGNDDIWNFEPVENLILPAGGEYHYQASLQNGQFTKSGQYDFEVGYYKDGEWFRIPVDPEQPEIENEVSIYVRPRWKAVTQRACYNEDNLEGTPLLDTNGNKWYELDFEPPLSWNYTRLPENNTFGSGWDRFFRYEFNLASATVVNKTVFASDDGLWLWINGQYINHWGANCGGSRCVNDPTGRCANNTNVDPVELVNLQAGKNVIAIRVNNGACCHSYFDAQVLASLLEEALAGLNPLMRGNIIEVWDFNPGQIRNRYYSVDYVQNIQAILNFQGSTLRLNVYRPNGTLYNSWQSSIPPINITIPNAEVGTWRFEVRAVSVPHNNYLCTLVIAGETSCETSAGQYVEVFPLQELSLKFSQVDTAGCTTASRSDSGTAINGKYQILSEPIYYQMETDATFHGEVDICIFYDENIIGQANEADLMLLQNINGVWENVSISLDQISNIICGTTTQLGEFALVAGIEQIIPVISLEMNLPAGWSMISLPVKPQNCTVSALFPKAEVVYSYEKGAGYVRVPSNEDLEAGKGYWILSYEDQNSVLTGQSIPSYADTVSEDGWSMIGGCSSDAKVSTNGCKIGVIYKYALGSGYQRVPTSEALEPCHGYWILFQDIVGQCQFTVEETGG